jgi:hypothetical protein
MPHVFGGVIRITTVLTSWFSFKRDFGADAPAVRSLGRSGSVPALCTKFLRDPKLRRRWSSALLSSSAWELARAAVEDASGGNIALVQRAVSLLEDCIKLSAAPFQPKGEHPTSPHTRAPMLPPAWAVLECEAGALCASIHHMQTIASRPKAPFSQPGTPCASLARPWRWDLTFLTPGIWDTGDWDGWRARVSAACGAVQREGARRRRSTHTACISYHIERRALHGINAEEGVPGGLRSLIRKVGRAGCPPISPKQVRTAAGGGSTRLHCQTCHLA